MKSSYFRNRAVQLHTAIGRTILFLATLLSLWLLLAPRLAQHLVVTRALDRADAILVLAGSAAYWERTSAAAALYRQGVAPKVVLSDEGTESGWSAGEQVNLSFTVLAKRNLVAHGVPENAIEVLPARVHGTIDEARQAAVRAAQGKWRALVLVTSPYHTRRAYRAFENAFLESAAATQLGIVGAAEPGARAGWVPLRRWRDVASEYVKLVYYDLFYY